MGRSGMMHDCIMLETYPLHHFSHHKQHVPCSFHACVSNLGARLVTAFFSSPVVFPGLLLLHECRGTVLKCTTSRLLPTLTFSTRYVFQSNFSELGTGRPSTPQVWSLGEVVSISDHQAHREVRKLSCTKKRTKNIKTDQAKLLKKIDIRVAV
ncbi:hypothetical protein T4D_2026 [Trichinella pseudospiralis]|uniref:Uncharacterized protein n=1 Tax=Trichinella pseudospiralis TaxID=6337 RepID=A0A0V1F3Z6_TRIPS|nr:hypothetical protein T4D_2026 [Trichinella pseudospiralis]